MRTLIPSLVFVVLATLVGAWVLRDEIEYLRSYQGSVIRSYKEDVPHADTGGYLTYYLLELKTPTGDVNVVKVTPSIFAEAQTGKTIIKNRFSSRTFVQ